jgi:hypothetical protein
MADNKINRIVCRIKIAEISGDEFKTMLKRQHFIISKSKIILIFLWVHPKYQINTSYNSG